MTLFLEDLAVGDTFQSAAYRIDAEQIIRFAREFDPQPFHTDAAAAQDTFFAGLVASGWHTTALAMRLMVASMPLAGGLVGAGAEVTWSSATRPGETLHVVSTIQEIRPSRSKPDRAVLTVESRMMNASDELKQTIVSKTFAFRRPRGAAP